MLTKNPAIFKSIDKLAEHFHNNVANKYLRAAVYRVDLSRMDTEQYQELLEKSDLYKYQGHHLDELYLKLLSFARFVKAARREVVPNAKVYALNSIRDQSASEKTLAEMAGANFDSNLRVLADLIKELYAMVIKEDESLNNGKALSLAKTPEAKEIPSLLG